MSEEVLKSHKKKPAEQLDYSIDYTPHLVEGETIVSSTWSVTPNNGTLVVVSSLFGPTGATIWVNAGTPGVKYRLGSVVTTNSSPPRIIKQVLLLGIEL